MLTECPCTSEKNFNVKQTGSQNFALSDSSLKESVISMFWFKKVVNFLPRPKPNAAASHLINSAKFAGAAGSAIKKNIDIIWDVI